MRRFGVGWALASSLTMSHNRLLAELIRPFMLLDTSRQMTRSMFAGLTGSSARSGPASATHVIAKVARMRVRSMASPLRHVPTIPSAQRRRRGEPWDGFKRLRIALENGLHCTGAHPPHPRQRYVLAPPVCQVGSRLAYRLS